MSLYNSGMYCPLQGGQLQFGDSAFQRNPNASVPNQVPSFTGFGCACDDGLHTPHQDIPMPVVGGSSRMTTPVRGEWNGGGYGWKNIAMGFLGNMGGTGTWNRQDELYFDPSRPREMSLGFSREDIEYAKMSERKNAEIVRNMDTRQKRLLTALSKGMIFKLSRLIPEKNPR